MNELKSQSLDQLIQDVQDISALIHSYEHLQKQFKTEDDISPDDLSKNKEILARLIDESITKYKPFIQQKMNTDETQIGTLHFLKLVYSILSDEIKQRQRPQPQPQPSEEIGMPPLEMAPMKQENETTSETSMKQENETTSIRSMKQENETTSQELIKQENETTSASAGSIKQERKIPSIRSIKQEQQTALVESLEQEKEMQIKQLELEIQQKTREEQEEAAKQLLKQKAIESFQQLPEDAKEQQLENVKKLDSLSKQLVQNDRTVSMLEIAINNPSLSAKDKKELVKQFLQEESKLTRSKKSWLDVVTTLAKTGGVMFCMYYINLLSQQRTEHLKQYTEQANLDVQRQFIIKDQMGEQTKQAQAATERLAQEGKNQQQEFAHKQTWSYLAAKPWESVDNLVTTAGNVVGDLQEAVGSVERVALGLNDTINNLWSGIAGGGGRFMDMFKPSQPTPPAK